MKLIAMSALFAVLTFSAFAQEEDGGMDLIQKPVLCMDKDRLIWNAKENGLAPLVGAIGKSFTGSLVKGESTIEVFYLVAYNPEQGNYSFLEFRKDGTACMLGGGWNSLIFDYDEIDEQLGWE